MKNENVVYIQLDNWNDMEEAHSYLEELTSGKHDNDVNYSVVQYDMATIYCITTTEEYAIKHNLIGHMTDRFSLLGKYFPKYNPDNFGCEWDIQHYDEYFKRIEKMLSDDWEGDEEIFVPEEECSKPFNTPKILGCVKNGDKNLFETMYNESERVYNEEYSTGEYCHEQSFKWGFQEGSKWTEIEMLNQMEDYLRKTYISAIGETDYSIDDMIEDFRTHFNIK